MSQRTLRGAIHPHLATPMRGRDPTEAGRASTPLELSFDLVAVALAAERLHHAIAEGVGVASLVSYALVFVAVWLAWVNFTCSPRPMTPTTSSTAWACWSS